MGLTGKRRAVTRSAVRKAWQENLAWISDYGFCSYTREAIEDDYEDLRVCWCCGVTGYQEVAHIIPHSLGGTHLPINSFLLCAECHLTSPDCSDPKYFVEFINRHAGRFNTAFAETFKRMTNRLLEFCEQEPEKAEAVQAALSEQYLDSGGRISTHGSNYSISTKMAGVEMALDRAIELVQRNPACK
ncbi:hypothetical protein AO242_26110 [Pseudomonas sp. ICMP 561]|nr:hypothetical protein AO242_26110 [Pseudomonas sp. ICMP 561]